MQFKTPKTITKLYFNKASYFLGDDFGNEILLQVNYRENKFAGKISKKKNANISILKQEIDKFAKDLLKRKSGINMAPK